MICKFYAETGGQLDEADSIGIFTVWIVGETCTFPDKINEEDPILHDNLTVTYRCPVLFGVESKNSRICNLD